MTVKILHAEKRQLDDWKAYFDALKNKGAYHDPEYIKILEKHYQDEAELFIFENKEEFIYYPYFKRKLSRLRHLDGCGIDLDDYYDIASSWYYGGPLASCYNKALVEKFRESFQKYCYDSNIVSEFIRFDPYLSNDVNVDKSVKVLPNREVIYIDLHPSKEKILKNYTYACRKNVHRASENNITIKLDRELEKLDEFICLYSAEMKRKNAPEGYFFNKDFFRQILLKSKDTYFFNAYVKDKFAGGNIIVMKNGIAHEYLRATNPKYWHLRINNYLIHQTALFLKKNGAGLYDLQGGRKGVLEFKRNFSKLFHSFKVGHCIHIPKLYAQFASRLSKEQGNFFPAYRKNDRN